MSRLRTLLAVLFLGWAVGAGAAVEPLKFSSPEQEDRYRSLIEELRCLVCQNQNLADSDADLAKDLRRETYEMVKEGKSESEVVDFMVGRYGDFVLYRPPVKDTTVLLWLAPALLALVGLGVLIAQIRKRRTLAASAEAELTPEERARLKSVLEDNKEQRDA